MLVTLRSYTVKLPNLKSRKPIMISNRTVSRLTIREMIVMFSISILFVLFSCFLQELRCSFQTKNRLIFVMEYVNGGEVSVFT